MAACVGFFALGVSLDVVSISIVALPRCPLPVSSVWVVSITAMSIFVLILPVKFLSLSCSMCLLLCSVLS